MAAVYAWRANNLRNTGYGLAEPLDKVNGVAPRGSSGTWEDGRKANR